MTEERYDGIIIDDIIDDISRMNLEQIEKNASKLVPLLLHKTYHVRRAALRALIQLDPDTLATHAEPAVRAIGNAADFPDTIFDDGPALFEFLYFLSPNWLGPVHRLEIVKFLNGQEPWKTLAAGLILRRPPVGVHVGDLISILNAAREDYLHAPPDAKARAESRTAVALEALDKLVNVHDTDARPVVDALFTYPVIGMEDVIFRVLKKMSWLGHLELGHLEELYKFEEERFHKLVLETPPIVLMRNHKAMALLYAKKDMELIEHAEQALLPPSDNSPGGALYTESKERFEENATMLLAYRRHSRGGGL